MDTLIVSQPNTMIFFLFIFLLTISSLTEQYKISPKTLKISTKSLCQDGITGHTRRDLSAGLSSAVCLRSFVCVRLNIAPPLTQNTTVEYLIHRRRNSLLVGEKNVQSYLQIKSADKPVCVCARLILQFWQSLQITLNIFFTH